MITLVRTYCLKAGKGDSIPALNEQKLDAGGGPGAGADQPFTGYGRETGYQRSKKTGRIKRGDRSCLIHSATLRQGGRGDTSGSAMTEGRGHKSSDQKSKTSLGDRKGGGEASHRESRY